MAINGDDALVSTLKTFGVVPQTAATTVKTGTENTVNSDFQDTSADLHRGTTAVATDGQTSSTADAAIRDAFNTGGQWSKGNDYLSRSDDPNAAPGESAYSTFLRNQRAKQQELLNSPDPSIRAAAYKALAETPIARDSFTSGASGENDYRRAIEEQRQAKSSIAKGEIQGASTTASDSALAALQERAVAGRSDLAVDPKLATYGDLASQYANGLAGRDIGGTQARVAGQQIGDAGRDSRSLAMDAARQQFAQANRSAQDLGMVRDSAQGKGPSAAAILGSKMIADNARSMSAQAATARGGNLASAQRSAILGGSNANLQGTQQIMAQRAQEQLNAQQLLTSGNSTLGQQYGNLAYNASGIRAGDVTQATSAADSLNRTYSTNADLAKTGLGAMSDANAQRWQQNAGVSDRNAQDDQAYFDALQKQYAIESGVSVQYNGQDLANDASLRDDANQKTAAGAARLGATVAKLGI